MPLIVPPEGQWAMHALELGYTGVVNLGLTLTPDVSATRFFALHLQGKWDADAFVSNYGSDDVRCYLHLLSIFDWYEP